MESSAPRASPLPGGESPSRSCCPSKLPPRDGSSQPSFTTSCLTTVSAPSRLAKGREGPSYFSSGRGASQSQQSSDEGAVPSSRPSTAPRANVSPPATGYDESEPASLQLERNVVFG